MQLRLLNSNVRLNYSDLKWLGYNASLVRKLWARWAPAAPAGTALVVFAVTGNPRRQSKLDVRQWLLRRLLLVRALVRGGGAYSCRPLSNFTLNLCNVGWIGQHSLHR
jgi:hypothetical protein